MFFIGNAFHPGRLVVLGVVEDQKWDPKPLHILKRESILRPCPLQVPIFDSVVVPLVQVIKGCQYQALPFKKFFEGLELQAQQESQVNKPTELQQHYCLI